MRTGEPFRLKRCLLSARPHPHPLVPCFASFPSCRGSSLSEPLPWSSVRSAPVQSQGLLPPGGPRVSPLFCPLAPRGTASPPGYHRLSLRGSPAPVLPSLIHWAGQGRRDPSARNSGHAAHLLNHPPPTPPRCHHVSPTWGWSPDSFAKVQVYPPCLSYCFILQPHFFCHMPPTQLDGTLSRTSRLPGLPWCQAPLRTGPDRKSVV